MRVRSSFPGFFLVCLAALTAACAGARAPRPPAAPAAERPAEPVAEAAAEGAAAPGGEAAAESVRITLLHLNDVYEITPVEGGRRGGLARVATLRQRLLADNPNTFTVIAGDLFSPSALGTAKVDGERLDGKQMVAALNVMGLDYATFGNHEFDLGTEPFLARLAESRFQWFSANVFDAEGKPFPGVTPHEVLTVRAGSGRLVRLGLVGVTLDSNQPGYVTYQEPVAAFRRQVGLLAGEVDVLVGLTHLALADDVALAAAVPEIDLILGGHEHENWQVWRGAEFTPVFKADANARSVYVHDLTYDTASGELRIDSRLVPVGDDLPDEPATAAVVEEWVDKGFAGFRADGFDPEAAVAEVTEALDGREASVRNGSTRLTELIAAAMLADAAGSELAVYNSGSIRIDDVLPPGKVTQYDVIRVLPFGGKVLTVTMPGSLLARALEQGAASPGSGAFLQTANVGRDGAGWTVAGEPLAPERTYTVAINDYLASGKEKGMDFLKPPNLTVAGENRDVRMALIDELRKRYGS